MAWELPQSVAEAVGRDLRELAGRDEALASSALAASALRMARELDSDSSSTSKSMCAKALAETMDRLRALAPPPAVKDDLDELAKRRSARRSAA